MKNEIIFREEQRFRQVWIFLFLSGLFGFTLYSFINNAFAEQPPGDKTASDIALAVSLVIMAMVVVLFLAARLTAELRDDGVYFKFFPFHLEFRRIPWEDIEEAYVRKYSPLWEYGGWGWRSGLGGKGMAYTVAGNRGLQLVLKNGRKILLGTQKPDKLSGALLKTPMARDQ